MLFKRSPTGTEQQLHSCLIFSSCPIIFLEAAAVSDESTIMFPFRNGGPRPVAVQYVASAIVTLEKTDTYQIRPQLSAAGNPLAESDYHKIGRQFRGLVTDARYIFRPGMPALAKPAFIHALRVKLAECQPSEQQVKDAESILRRSTSYMRIIRDTAVSLQVKSDHNYICQVCEIPLETPKGRYAEGAHIWPLGRAGKDVAENILCLCPNDHVLFDSGALYIDDEFTVRRTGDGSPLRRLDIESRALGLDFVKFHRQFVAEMSQ